MNGVPSCDHPVPMLFLPLYQSLSPPTLSFSFYLIYEQLQYEMFCLNYMNIDDRVVLILAELITFMPFLEMFPLYNEVWLPTVVSDFSPL